MQSLRRIQNWSLFLGFLWAAGWAVFLYVRHSPRCVIVGPYSVARVSADGSRLVTRGYRPSGRPNAVQVWDTCRGNLIHQIDDEEDISDPVFSADGRYAALTVGRIPRLMECQTGEEWRFDELAGSGSRDFSPRGRWLLTLKAGAINCIDVARREAVPFPNAEFLCFNAHEQPVFKKRAGAPELFVWDLRQRKKIAQAAWDPDAEPHPSENGALAAVVSRKPADPDAAKRDYVVQVWDLATLERRFQRRLSIPALNWIEVKFSPDAQTAAILVNRLEASGPLRTRAQFLDMTTGALLGTTECCGGEFSPDGSLWFSLVPTDNDRDLFRVFDAPTGRVLWERPAGRVRQFLGATGALLYQEDLEKPLQLLDARTGQARARVRVDCGAAAFQPEPMNDGRRFTVFGYRHFNGEQPFWKAWLENLRPEIFGNPFVEAPFVMVFESATGRELLRLTNHGPTHVLSDDGRTLLTLDSLNDEANPIAIRVWDVSPAKAYLWAIGTAAGAGIVLLGLNRLRHKLTRRGPYSKHAPPAAATALTSMNTKRRFVDKDRKLAA
jgi:hypothetical protein